MLRYSLEFINIIISSVESILSPLGQKGKDAHNFLLGAAP